MGNRGEMVKLRSDERLRDSRRQTTSMALPLAVHQRLSMLTDGASAAAPTRAEIVAMLIANADLDEDRLEQAVLEYRRKTIGDVIPPAATESVDHPETGNVIQITRRSPGRPRRS